MSEPSIIAIEAAYQCFSIRHSESMTQRQLSMMFERHIQDAIDSALAPLREENEKLQATLKGYIGCRCLNCGRCPAEVTTVALIRINPKGELGQWICHECNRGETPTLNISIVKLREEIETLQLLVKGLEGNVSFLEKENAALTALVGKIMHTSTSQYLDSTGKFPCTLDCLACERDRLLGGGE